MGAMTNAFCKEGDFENIGRLLREMDARGLTVNACSYNNILAAKLRHG